MAEPLNEEINYEPPPARNVVPLFLATIAPRRKEAPVSDEELAEYRRLKPLLLQMLAEWEQIKGSGGCPVARSITAPPSD